MLGSCTIRSNNIFNIRNPELYKLYLARENKKGEKPLDVFVESYEEWIDWVSWRSDEEKKKNQDVWNRKYIFSVMDFYPQKKLNRWLFGGIFRVIIRYNNGNYEIKEVKEYEDFIGRVLLSYQRTPPSGGRVFNLENFINDFSIEQILGKGF